MEMMNTFLPSVPVSTHTARQLEDIAWLEGVTPARLVRDILEGYAEGYLARTGPAPDPAVGR